jgi:hypothetical protein
MTARLPGDSRHVKASGKPYAGKPHVRFDEGGQDWASPILVPTLLVNLFSAFQGTKRRNRFTDTILAVRKELAS